MLRLLPRWGNGFLDGPDPPACRPGSGVVWLTVGSCRATGFRTSVGSSTSRWRRTALGGRGAPLVNRGRQGMADAVEAAEEPWRDADREVPGWCAARHKENARAAKAF
jgi:hypothetical protein